MSKILTEKPNDQKLEQLGIKNWGTWACEPSRFPWEYDDKETCYVFEGRRHGGDAGWRGSGHRARRSGHVSQRPAMHVDRARENPKGVPVRVARLQRLCDCCSRSSSVVTRGT